MRELFLLKGSVRIVGSSGEIYTGTLADFQKDFGLTLELPEGVAGLRCRPDEGLMEYLDGWQNSSPAEGFVVWERRDAVARCLPDGLAACATRQQLATRALAREPAPQIEVKRIG